METLQKLQDCIKNFNIAYDPAHGKDYSVLHLYCIDTKDFRILENIGCFVLSEGEILLKIKDESFTFNLKEEK